MSKQNTIAILNEAVMKIRQQAGLTQEEIGATDTVDGVIETLGGTVVKPVVQRPVQKPKMQGGSWYEQSGMKPKPPAAGVVPPVDPKKRDPESDDNLR